MSKKEVNKKACTNVKNSNKEAFKGSNKQIYNTDLHFKLHLDLMIRENVFVKTWIEIDENNKYVCFVADCKDGLRGKKNGFKNADKVIVKLKEKYNIYKKTIVDVEVITDDDEIVEKVIIKTKNANYMSKDELFNECDRLLSLKSLVLIKVEDVGFYGSARFNVYIKEGNSPRKKPELDRLSKYLSEELGARILVREKK